VEVHLINGGERPRGGVGEVGPVTVLPALTNALFAAPPLPIRGNLRSRTDSTISPSLPIDVPGPKKTAAGVALRDEQPGSCLYVWR
jgi:hypothetical protein